VLFDAVNGQHQTDSAVIAQSNDLGGIDFKSDKVDNVLTVQNSGSAIRFNIDPAMLQQLQNAPGFVPVIINIQPMNDLHLFLGIEN